MMSQKVFDPYFTTKSNSHGLGLTSTYTIIQKHGGHITVNSDMGKGTSFSLFFPACPESIPPPENGPRRKQKGQGMVLVMDDEESIRLLVGEMLRACGYDYVMASNGLEALALYRKAFEANKPFAAVILDLTIPGGLGGKETMEELLKLDPMVKAIVASGYSNDPVMAKFESFGFRAVIPKPYNLVELSQVMHRVITGSSS